MNIKVLKLTLEKQKEIIKKGADCLASGSLLTAGVGKAGVGITEQVFSC